MRRRKLRTRAVKSSPVKRGRPSKSDIEAKRLALIKTNESPAERLARIAERFTVMYRLTQGAIHGAPRAMIVSGAPGVGKSFTITHLLETATDQNMIRHVQVHGTITGINLYKVMWNYQQPNDIILLDDADSIYEDEDSMNLLKAGLDTTTVRKISWLSEAASLKAEGIPTTFEYKGAIIFITNKDMQGIVDVGKSKMVPHFQALMSRSIYLDLKLHSPDDLVVWIGHMVRKQHILIQRGLTDAQEVMCVDWIQKNYENCRDLSIRTALKLADFMLADESSWQTFAKVTLLR